MLSIAPKNAILRKKAPSKLSLKKNIRRSSILDKKAILLRNDSLIDKNTSSGTVSLFSSSDSDIFEVSDDDKQTKCSGSTKTNASVVIEEIGSDVQCLTRKSDNLSLISSNVQDDEERRHINDTKNESVKLNSPICEKQSLILIHATSIPDNSTNSLFSSYCGDSLQLCGGDIVDFRNKLDGILNYKDEVRSPHITSFEKEENKMNSEEKEAVNNSVIVISPTIEDQLKDSEEPERNQHMAMLDRLYGREWRKAEKLVFSEPRLNRPSKTKINAPKTDIKPRKPNKSDKNAFPNGRKKANKLPLKKNLQNFYDSDTSEGDSKKELKTVRTKLFPKVVRKPVKSPWVQRLQSLCDSDTSEEESEKENKYNYKVSNKIKSKLNYDSSSTITSDSSNLDSSFITLTDDSCNSNSFSNINRKKVKTKRSKKSEKPEGSDEEKAEIEDKRGATTNIFDNKNVVFGTPRVDKRDKLPSMIKYLPSLNTSEIIQKSFMESLSACVPLNQCHPTARIFRNNYQAYKIQLTEKLFQLFNEKIFNNLIPDDNSVFWNVNLTKTAGYCKCSSSKNAGQTERKVKIFLSVKVLDSPERLRCTLLHEMIHAVCMISGTHDQHGPNFKAWGRKAIQVFPGLPPVTRCHSYEIKAKYTYKCLSCGLCKNRHSKSIDIMKKVCGRCHGKFELFINKIAQGEKKRVPVTPKTPTGFALFVKNNYAQCRTPELKHGEVMKLLGSKFNELKLSSGK